MVEKLKQVTGSSKVSIFLMATIIISLPFSFRFCTAAMIMFLLLTFSKVLFKGEKFFFYKKFSFWIPASIVVVSLIGMLYTSNTKDGLGIVERQASLILFPLIFTQLEITKDEFNGFKKIFISAFVFLILILEIRIFWLILNSSEHDFVKYFFSYYYTYSNLTTPYVVQAVYLGTIITLSDIFCFSIIKNSVKQKEKIIYASIIILNTFFLFQLSARSSIILNLAAISFYICYIFYDKKRIALGVLLVLTILFLSALLFFSSGFTKSRMSHVFTEITSDNLKIVDPHSRMLIWPCAIEIIGENWVLGVGTGDAEDQLLNKYKEKNLSSLLEAGLNAHNQYLTLLMRHGVMGLFVLLLNFVFPLYLYFKTKNVEAVLFTILIAGFFLTENVLTRAQGVLFVAFFHAIFIVMPFSIKTHENTGIRN